METEKWVCRKCGHETFTKPYKNQTCDCKGRFVHYKKCKCGEWFEDKGYSKRYCSSDCSGRKRTNIRVGKLRVVCDNCGQEFLRYAANVHEGLHFCNAECKQAYYKAVKNKAKCACCGKTFEIYASVLRTNASGKYCSKECYWKSLEKEGRSYKGFSRAKKLYFSGKQVCAICGTDQKIDIHHIIPNRISQNQSRENLIPLCKRHHCMVERLTAQLHVDFENNHELELFLLNAILRPRQAATFSAIKNAKMEGGE